MRPAAILILKVIVIIVILNWLQHLLQYLRKQQAFWLLCIFTSYRKALKANLKFLVHYKKRNRRTAFIRRQTTGFGGQKKPDERHPVRIAFFKYLISWCGFREQ